jgi:hypothetical protein
MAKNTRSHDVRPGQDPTNPGVRLPPDPPSRFPSITTITLGSTEPASEPTVTHLTIVEGPRGPANPEGFKAECVIDGRSYLTVDAVVYEITDGTEIRRVSDPEADIRGLLKRDAASSHERRSPSGEFRPHGLTFRDERQHDGMQAHRDTGARAPGARPVHFDAPGERHGPELAADDGAAPV